jgi:hypothetical protein
MAIGIARLTQYQAPHSLRKLVNFNDAGVSTGVLVGTIPAGSIITAVIVQIATVFNAATTNVLTVGTTGTGTDLMTSAEAIAGTQGQKTAAASRRRPLRTPSRTIRTSSLPTLRPALPRRRRTAYVLISYHPNNDR